MIDGTVSPRETYVVYETQKIEALALLALCWKKTTTKKNNNKKKQQKKKTTTKNNNKKQQQQKKTTKNHTHTNKQRAVV